jgi:hypothetical protein
MFRLVITARACAEGVCTTGHETTPVARRRHELQLVGLGHKRDIRSRPQSSGAFSPMAKRVPGGMLAVMELSLRKEESVMPARRTRIGLIALQLFVALNAVAGSVYLFGGAPDWPRTWLESTPFNSWVIPGVILLVAVGGSMATAAWTTWRRPESGASASLLAGLVLLVWIIVETAMLGYISWMQPATLVAALLVLALAWHLRRGSSMLRTRGSVAA